MSYTSYSGANNYATPIGAVLLTTGANKIVPYQPIGTAGAVGLQADADSQFALDYAGALLGTARCELQGVYAINAAVSASLVVGPGGDIDLSMAIVVTKYGVVNQGAVGQAFYYDKKSALVTGGVAGSPLFSASCIVALNPGDEVTVTVKSATVAACQINGGADTSLTIQKIF